MTAQRGAGVDPVQKELSDIKRLLVLALLRDGSTQTEVARALGVGQSTVSRMFPGGVNVKPTEKKTE